MVGRTREIFSHSTTPLKRARTPAFLEMTTNSDMQLSPNHPNGHKIFSLQEIWIEMDKQDFLRLTDSWKMQATWCLPIFIRPKNDSESYLEVFTLEVIIAPNIKFRYDSSHVMSTIEFMKVLYLTAMTFFDIDGKERVAYDEWVQGKIEKAKKDGIPEEQLNAIRFINYLIYEDDEMRGFIYGGDEQTINFGIFFRKSCYHRYCEDERDCFADEPFTNPSMIKCESKKSTFEYIFEVAIKPIKSEILLNAMKYGEELKKDYDENKELEQKAADMLDKDISAQPFPF